MLWLVHRVGGESLVDARNAILEKIHRMGTSSSRQSRAPFHFSDVLFLTGTLRACSLYLIGNPLITSEITDIRAGTLVPFRVELYADAGKAVISYDRPASLSTLENPAFDALGISLDAKMQNLIGALANPADLQPSDP